jgi:hypothetical protein
MCGSVYIVNMSIKIIKNGTSTEYVKICPYCGCVFTYRKVDTQCVVGEDYRMLECPMEECKQLSRATWKVYDEGVDWTNPELKGRV